MEDIVKKPDDLKIITNIYKDILNNSSSADILQEKCKKVTEHVNLDRMADIKLYTARKIPAKEDIDQLSQRDDNQDILADDWDNKDNYDGSI